MKTFITRTSAIKMSAIGCVVLATLLPAAAFSRSGGGMGGMHHSSSTSMNGGAFGTGPTAPGTNSAGTALSSSGVGSVENGPALGTGDPAVAKEDRKAERMISSICKGC